MHRIIISTPSYLLGQTLKQTLISRGDFQVTLVDNVQQIVPLSLRLVANIVLMEVVSYAPYTLEQCLLMRDEIKKKNPRCKIVLLVNDQAEQLLSEKVVQAKKDGLIDQFIFNSTSANYLLAILDSL